MFGKHFELNDQTLHIVEEIGRQMPGGFFIYKAAQPEELLFANQAVFDIFGCKDLDEFKELTGYTFKGMLHPEDYDHISDSIVEQINNSDENFDYVEYRIIRKDGLIRWVDDYGHYTETETYGGIYYVFISDITKKHERIHSDLAMRQAVIEALSESYYTMWLITDIQAGTFSIYRGGSDAAIYNEIRGMAEFNGMNYSQAKDYFIEKTVAEEDRARLHNDLTIENILSCLKEKSRWYVNYRRIMKDGSLKYFRIEFAKLNMENGGMGIVCGFKDIDDETKEQIKLHQALVKAKQVEEDNRRLIEEVQSAAKLADLMGSVASLLSNMPAMSFSKDAKTGVYLACNQAFAEYAHKATPDEVIGLTDHDIFDKDTADHFVEDDQKALASDKPYIFFEDVPDAVGNMRNLQTTKLKFNDASGRLCTLGMCVDVTEMTKAKETEMRKQELERRLELQEKLLEEERQRARQEKLITALASDYWSVYYLELDTDEGVCYQAHADVEDGFKVGDHFKYLKSVTDYANRYITDQYREEFLKFIRPENIKAGLRENRVISFRYMVSRHGKESYEMVRFAGVRHPEDRTDHLVHAVGACFTDVDAETRKNMEQSEILNRALDEAKSASRAKTAFLSNMSHEIRTPMNAIIGLDNIALNDPSISEKTREHLKKIGSSAQHLLNIINDILDMSRIESGRMTLKNEEFSFSKALEQVNTIIGGQCRDKLLDYECRIHDTVSDYYIGDDMKLRQIFINILGNSVKFTPSGGKVSFTIEEIAKFDGKSTLKFVMEDNGIGMSKDFIPKIFDAFSQEDTSATNKYGSTGLGMPITKNLVELMNGNIEVESEKGKGTKFTVTVTLTDSPKKVFEPTDDFLPEKIKVLVIDDDPIACEHAKLVLDQVGISCDIALSGVEALDMVKVRAERREQYNLILVDWRMPEMDGIETTRQIRSIVGNETAIIILTSYNWDDVADEAKLAGVDTFVPKPLFASTVMDEFREAFRKKNESQFRKKTDLKGKRILLAEDVSVNAEIMTMVLSMKEMEVDVAENGQIAVELFRTHEPGYFDAILMDMRMPIMDGLEATRVIRAMKRADAKTIPMIALTANAFDEDVQRSMQAGLNAHLSKPVQPEALYETLESLIN
ncbi:MAG: response regulator [Spirochaetales bacterium]|nr:response regulator [Spirochaetales bacterium]